MGPGPDEETPEERRRRKEEQRRRRREEREDASDAVDGAADVAEAASGWGVPTGCGGRGGGGRSGGGRGGGSDGWGCGGSGGGRGGGSGCGSGGGGGKGGGGCDGCDGCDCNLSLFSTLLLVAATVLPESGTRSLVHGLIRLYQRLLTRFTPRCPSTPSCSAYASTAVRTLGTRRGLAAAAHRVRHCGRPQ